MVSGRVLMMLDAGPREEDFIPYGDSEFPICCKNEYHLRRLGDDPSVTGTEPSGMVARERGGQCSAHSG